MKNIELKYDGSQSAGEQITIIVEAVNTLQETVEEMSIQLDLLKGYMIATPIKTTSSGSVPTPTPVEDKISCPACDGDGLRHNFINGEIDGDTCGRCNGKGFIHPPLQEQGKGGDIDCPKCGYHYPDSYSECTVCHGTGKQDDPLSIKKEQGESTPTQETEEWTDGKTKSAFIKFLQDSKNKDLRFWQSISAFLNIPFIYTSRENIHKYEYKRGLFDMFYIEQDDKDNL